jgi:diketogulonate reductase-like aldo/keto reductase
MIKRRQLLQLSASLLAGQSLGLGADELTNTDSESTLIQRPIPSSGELLPVMGMGTSRTFDTAGDAESLANLNQVMQAFFNAGGTAIDSSPMYGNAETRVGDVLRAMQQPPRLFAATKVWTTGREQGIAQMNESARRMNVKRFDLIAVHNLQDWKVHLDTLKRWKEAGKVRYIGITTSHGRDHEEFLQVMRTEPIDFAQFSYNIEDRTAEQQLLPVAAERGIATMINRPYQRGALFSKSRGNELPGLAGELGCSSWAQFYLKYILGHPAVTCIIPATASVRHMIDNMQANFGPVPDAQQRGEMLRVFQQL